jgi:penicillin-binding protein 1A
MGRAEERRARQRAGRRAAPRRSSGTPTTGVASPSAGLDGTPTTVDGTPTTVGGRAAARRAAKGGGRAARGAKAGKGGKKGIRRFFTWKKILGTFLGFCLLGIGAFIVLYLMVPVPSGNAAEQAAQRQSNIYKYSDGSVLARDGKVNREIVDLSRVPKKVQYTFVAAENKTFFHDSGIDFKGTARGLLNTVMGRGAQGGSTITQQYVKNYYLSQEQTVTRKLREMVISLKVDRQKSKDEILAGYINTSYYGRGAYGIQAAAQAYYRVDAEKLSVAQGAYLAALLQAPSQYDWQAASDTGKRLVEARWNYVLDNMVEEHWLDKADRDEMKFPKPKEPKPASGREGQKGYFIELANYQLQTQLMKQEGISRDQAAAEVVDQGWTITLNIDKKKQAQLEKAVKAQLNSKLDPKKRKVDKNIQAGAASVDPKTGKIVALYGGVDYFRHYTSNATRADYQPASTFKPVILAAALENQAQTQSGKPITATTIYDGTSKRPVVNAAGDKVGFAPENEDDQNYGPITVQRAMNQSVNSVFAQMGVDVGMDKVLDVATKLGMDTGKLKPLPAYTLGTMGASPLQMAGVYATLDNHGKQVTPSILKAAEHRTRTAPMPEPIGEQVISPQAADAVTSVLTGVVDDGTARVSVANNAERDGQKVAGKTGTSDDNKSAWFTGYTPDLVTSVGLFGEDYKTHAQAKMYGAGGEDRVNGGGFPAKIWAQYMFNVTSPNAKFDLDTDQGAAVQPTWTPTPTQRETEEPTQEPTTKEPTQTPTTQEPTQTPTTQEPTDEPTTQEPTQDPTARPTDDIPTSPVDPADEQ